MELKRVVAVLDRIAHGSLTDIDCVQSVRGLQRLLDGMLPSEVLVPASAARHRAYDAWQKEIATLKQKLADVEGEKATTERERARLIKKLITEIATLQVRLDKITDNTGPCDFYTYDQVIQAMVKKFGKHHGVPAALAERNRHLLTQDPSLGRITVSTMQQWRKLNRYPCYVVEQIESMTPDDILPRGKWNDVERQFLIALYVADERQSNKALGAACSAQFGRLITECSIKGELNRLRLRGLISQYRAKD